MDTSIPHKVKVHLEEIAKRLSNGRASVLIGSGFSKNADCVGDSSLKFPDWNELGDLFYKKTHGSYPQKDVTYLNPLRLAEEVEAVHSRKVLNELLKESIPDDNYKPSSLHKDLLSLPWADVFTTNYDTLLERAADEIYSIRYQLVRSKDDLIWSSSPRVIKLHGSFDVEDSFIITEEDYRQYPKINAPFVNTIQQSLLENTLCLVGFSATDPNFLHWIGWIRDNLGKEKSPKLYFISCKSISISEQKILQSRNIEVLDLSFWKPQVTQGEDPYSICLKSFFQFLADERKNAYWKDWDYGRTENNIKASNEKEEVELELCYQKWKEKRESYPQWLVLPHKKRVGFLDDVISSGENLTKALKLKANSLNPVDLIFLYEFNWRLETCLYPILNEWYSSYTQIISRYNPFFAALTIENALILDSEEKEIIQCRVYWVELVLALMRFCREEGLTLDWKKWNSYIVPIEEKLSTDQIAKYHYECCLDAWFNLDIPSLKKELRKWTINSNLPYWEAKRAGLLAEIGDVDEAKKILKESLRIVRKQEKTVSIARNYKLFSQEAYLIWFLNYLDSYNENENFENEQRLNELRIYNCDPGNESNYFEVVLRKTEEFKSIEVKSGFDIGNKRTIYSLGGHDKTLVDSYTYLRFLEETGIPNRFPGVCLYPNQLLEALKRMALTSPKWAFILLVRQNDTKLVDEILSRSAVERLNKEKVDSFTELCLNTLVRILKEDSSQYSPGFERAFLHVASETLSRLCAKCSLSLRDQMIDVLLSIYQFGYKNRRLIDYLENWVRRLVSSFSEEEYRARLSKLLSFPLVDDSSNCPDPICSRFNLKSLCKDDFGNQWNNIDTWIDMVGLSGIKREKAIIRVNMVFKHNLLTTKQQQEFVNKLWVKTDSNGFPNELPNYTNLYSKVFEWGAPNSVNLQNLYEKYLNKNKKIKIRSVKEDKGGFDILSLPPYLRFLIELLQSKRFQWSTEQLSSVVNQMELWWDEEKDYLLRKEDFSFRVMINQEVDNQLNNLDTVLKLLVKYHKKALSDSSLKKIKRIILEYPQYRRDDLGVKCAFLPYASHEEIEKLFNDFIFAFSCLDLVRVSSSLRTFYRCLDVEQDKFNKELLVEEICQHIQSNKEPGLSSMINTMADIMKKYPQYIRDKCLKKLNIGIRVLNCKMKKEEYWKEVGDEKYSLQKSLAILLPQLKKYYQKENTPEEPKHIKELENMFFDPNSFTELKNILIDSGVYSSVNNC